MDKNVNELQMPEFHFSRETTALQTKMSNSKWITV